MFEIATRTVNAMNHIRNSRKEHKQKMKMMAHNEEIMLNAIDNAFANLK